MKLIHFLNILNNKNYPLYHRLIEIIGVFFYVYYFFMILQRLYSTISINFSLILGLFVLLDIVLAYIIADFTAGLVHFLCDNFGDENTPYLGKSIIKSFREHHEKPFTITQHDFLEVNGSNILASSILLAIYFHLINITEIYLLVILDSLIIFFTFFIVLTNQIHCWAHQKSNTIPKFIRILQKYGVILSPKNHQIHHTYPYDEYYCVTNGWFNAWFKKIGLFRYLKKILQFQNKL